MKKDNSDILVRPICADVFEIAISPAAVVAFGSEEAIRIATEGLKKQQVTRQAP